LAVRQYNGEVLQTKELPGEEHNPDAITVRERTQDEKVSCISADYDCNPGPTVSSLRHVESGTISPPGSSSK
jgi:hypothetical protein